MKWANGEKEEGDTYTWHGSVEADESQRESEWRQMDRQT